MSAGRERRQTLEQLDGWLRTPMLVLSRLWLVIVLTVLGSRVILSDRDRLVRFCKPDPLIDGRELSLGVTAI